MALTISPVKAQLVVALFVILYQVEGNLLEPLEMGRQVSLHPAMALIPLLIRGMLLGLVGGSWRFPPRCFRRPC